MSRRTRYRVMAYGPACALLISAAAQVAAGNWVAAFAIAAGCACMAISAGQLRRLFHLGYSRGVVDQIVQEYTPPLDRRPPGLRPEPWDAMFGPAPQMPAALRRHIEGEDDSQG